MPAPTNLSFETPGEQAGLASSWTLSTLSAAFEKAGFDAAVYPDPSPSPEPVDWADVDVIGAVGTFIPEIIAPHGYFSLVFDLIAMVSSTAYAAGEHNIIYFDADNRLYFDGTADRFVFRVNGLSLPTPTVAWTGTTTLTLTWKHLASTGTELTVAGATSGNGTSTSGAGTPIEGLPRVGYAIGLPGQPEPQFAVGSWTAVLDLVDFEAFERRWGNFYYDQAHDAALFESQPFLFSLLSESFEVEWDVFLRGLASTAEAEFDADPGPPKNAESFEQTGPYLRELTSFEATPFGVETFDTVGWDPAYNLTLIGLATALFAGSHLDTAETFNRVQGPWPVTVAPSPASELGWTGHPFLTDDQVGFVTSGAFPLGISDGLLFFVVNPTSLAFQISQSPGGAPVAIGDYGSGQLRVFGDPALFWVDLF